MRGRHHDPEIIILEEEGGSPLAWLLVGAALGAGVALLFAPASGEETRRRLGDQARQLRDKAEDTLEDLRERFDDVRDDLVEAAGEVKEAVRGVGRKRTAEPGGGPDEPDDELELVDEAEELPRRAAAPSARAELERRLAAARARRRTAVAEDEEPVA